MSTRTDELIEFHRKNGTLSEFPSLAAHADETAKAEASMRATLAANQAEREERQRLNTPIAVVLPTVPTAANDTAIIQFGRRPVLSSAIVDGQVYHPQLAPGPICFLPARFAEALTALQMNRADGWLWCTVARVVALDELVSPEAFRTIVANMTTKSIPCGIVAYRRLAGRSGSLAKSQTRLLDNMLSRLSHPVSGNVVVMPTARPEYEAEERAADQILALAGPLAAPSPADEDPIERQLVAVNGQATRLLDRQIERANRDAIAAGES